MAQKQMDLEEIGEEDNRSSEELCASLKAQTKKVAELYLDCELQYRTFHKQIIDTMDPIYEAKLVPKDALKAWLKERNLEESLTFQEFLQAFLAEHKKEDRLDLSTRSILLNTAACGLIGYRSTRGAISFLDLLEKLAILFE